MSAALTATCPAACGRGRAIAATLDWAERGLIVSLYGWLVARIVIAATVQGSWGNLMLLPSEGLVLLFILIRRSTDDVSRHPVHWALALAGTAAPMLVQSGGDRILVPPVAAAALIFLGMVVQIHAKLILGRSMGCVPANRGLKFSGPYQCLRHPMYAGYLVTHFAFLLMNPNLWNVALYIVCGATQVARILAEERLLARDPLYVKYLATVRYRLIPGVF
ncbi:MAG: methyltransferase family protein [Thermoguttaceae bacterium]